MKLETLIQKLKVAQKTHPNADTDVVIQYCDYECEPTFVSTTDGTTVLHVEEISTYQDALDDVHLDFVDRDTVEEDLINDSDPAYDLYIDEKFEESLDLYYVPDEKFAEPVLVMMHD